MYDERLYEIKMMGSTIDRDHPIDLLDEEDVNATITYTQGLVDELDKMLSATATSDELTTYDTRIADLTGWKTEFEQRFAHIKAWPTLDEFRRPHIDGAIDFTTLDYDQAILFVKQAVHEGGDDTTIRLAYARLLYLLNKNEDLRRETADELEDEIAAHRREINEVKGWFTDFLEKAEARKRLLRLRETNPDEAARIEDLAYLQRQESRVGGPIYITDAYFDEHGVEHAITEDEGDLDPDPDNPDLWPTGDEDEEENESYLPEDEDDDPE